MPNSSSRRAARDAALTDFHPGSNVISESAVEAYSDAGMERGVSTVGTITLPDASAPPKGGRRRLGGYGFGFWMATAWLALVTFIAIFVNLLPFDDPLRTGLGIPGET